MAHRLAIATRNEKKKRELLQMLHDLPVELLTLNDFPDVPEVVEDGETFTENAIKKAAVVAGLTGEYTLADDSGLEVDAINGQPGVYSARFAGEQGNDELNNQKLIKLLENVPEEKRTARFRCVIAIVSPDGKAETAEGICEGKIILEPRGNEGFGYDPLFIPNGYDKTFAELSAEEKHKISHRGRALTEAQKIIKIWLQQPGR